MDGKLYDQLINWHDINIAALQDAIIRETKKQVPDEDDISFMEGQVYGLGLAKRHLLDTLRIWGEHSD